MPAAFASSCVNQTAPAVETGPGCPAWGQSGSSALGICPVAAFGSCAFHPLREALVLKGDLQHAIPEARRTHRVGLFPGLFGAGAPVRRILALGVGRPGSVMVLVVVAVFALGIILLGSLMLIDKRTKSF